MGRKLNPEWRERNAERLAAQERCIWCRKLNHPRYLIHTEQGYAHRLCAKAASMNPEEILEWQRKAENYEVKDSPPMWAVLRAEQEVENRKRREGDRQAHLAIKNFWTQEEEQ